MCHSGYVKNVSLRVCLLYFKIYLNSWWGRQVLFFDTEVKKKGSKLRNREERYVGLRGTHIYRIRKNKMQKTACKWVHEKWIKNWPELIFTFRSQSSQAVINPLLYCFMVRSFRARLRWEQAIILTYQLLYRIHVFFDCLCFDWNRSHDFPRKNDLLRIISLFIDIKSNAKSSSFPHKLWFALKIACAVCKYLYGIVKIMTMVKISWF